MTDRAYRDPLDSDATVSTDAAAAIGDDDIAAQLATVTRELHVTGKALLTAADAYVASTLPDPLDAAAELAGLCEALEQRRNRAITRLVVDAQVSTRQVADRLGWTPARVAFACKAPRQQ